LQTLFGQFPFKLCFFPEFFSFFKKVFNRRSKINISKQKNGKKGKTITLIRGLGTEDEILLKELLKKIKVFCGTGGTFNDNNIQLQGDMVSKSFEFLRKEGFHNL